MKNTEKVLTFGELKDGDLFIRRPMNTQDTKQPLFRKAGGGGPNGKSFEGDGGDMVEDDEPVIQIFLR